MSERSDNIIRDANAAKLKFEYFLAGITVAFCTLVIKELEIKHPGLLNPGMVELYGIILLLISLVFNLFKIREEIYIMDHNGFQLHYDWEKLLLSGVGSGDMVKLREEQYPKPEERKVKIAELDGLSDKAKSEIKKSKKNCLWLHWFRIGFLILGILVIIASKVMHPYF